MILLKYKFNNLFIVIVVSLLTYLAIIPSQVYAFGVCTDPKDFVCLDAIFIGVSRSAVGFLMFVLLFTIISGGIKWLTSSGDPKDIENAKGRITFAIFGLFIIIASWFILKFLSKFTGVSDILLFETPR